VLEAFSILAYRGKAYLPTHSKLGSGSYIPIGPVIVAELTSEGLQDAINQLTTAGHPAGPNPLTREFWKTYKEPLQQATRVKSQKQLDREGLHYTVMWAPDHILLTMPKPNPADRPRDEHGVPRTFPLDTPIAEIIGVILDNVQQLSHQP